MKCDDFLAAQNSGSRWREWQARRHARRCAQCSAAARVDAMLRQELSQVEPLSPAQRAIWIGAAETAVGRPPRVPRYWSWATATIAAALLIAVIGLCWTRSDRWLVALRPPPAAPDDAAAGQAPEPASLPVPFSPSNDAVAELDDLLTRVDDLQREIETLMMRAELLAARQQVERMIATYSHW